MTRSFIGLSRSSIPVFFHRAVTFLLSASQRRSFQQRAAHRALPLEVSFGVISSCNFCVMPRFDVGSISSRINIYA